MGTAEELDALWALFPEKEQKLVLMGPSFSMTKAYSTSVLAKQREAFRKEQEIHDCPIAKQYRELHAQLEDDFIEAALTIPASLMMNDYMEYRRQLAEKLHLPLYALHYKRLQTRVEDEKKRRLFLADK